MKTTLMIAMAALILAQTTAAMAYTRLTHSSCSTGLAWPSSTDPKIKFSDHDRPSVSEHNDMKDATLDVMTRIETVGGTWFDFGTVSDHSTELKNNWPNKNQIGWDDSLDSTGTTVTLAETGVYSKNCKIVEADIGTNPDLNFHYGVPDDEGDDYFTAELDNGSGRYHRLTMMHELFHFAGFDHSDNSYSFMNYKDRPWANRSDAKMVEPLPDDREALRDIYPGSASECDLAVLNTWFDSSDTSNGAARQKLLCAPSTGSSYSSSIWSDTCGVDGWTDGDTEVCPGDTLYVRYAVANYGTTSESYDEELWLSANTNLNTTAGADKKSPTTRSNTLGANVSHRHGRTFEVPSGVTYDSEYYVIMNIDTGNHLNNEESTQNNWIPLTGKVRIKPWSDCVTIVGPIFTFP